ncbi:MAG: CDP-glycerol glycerophosphotransferase family protein [Clostridia bacterium]|nr:CDP-glycerol glycerophosphotransferase family protein [Clostridia bacterium]
MKSYFCCNRAEIVIASCKPFCKYKGNEKQLNIYLDHGSQLKNMKTNNCKVKLSCDYIISQGHFLNKYLVDQYTISEHQILTCGIPRNDQFYHDTKSLSSIYEDYDIFGKIIAWVPTF